MLKGILKILGLDPNDRLVARYRERASDIGLLERDVQMMNDADLKDSADFFRERLFEGETLDEILPEVFARVREVSRRTLGLRHFDEQLIGGIALHERKIAEMKTGEGKTLVATLAVVLNAMEDNGVHVVTVNDYLAKRDAEWMGPIYSGMGLSVGVISPFMNQTDRAEAYAADITYGTNSEFGFDYLRDNMALSADAQVQRGHSYCIVDEVDSILIDEARTPLIISGPSEDNVEPYKRADSVARSLHKGVDFEVDEKERNVALTEDGIAHCEKLLNLPDLFTDYANTELAHKVTQSLKAYNLFQRDIHYVVENGEVIIIDEFTGRPMIGRRYSEGLHQAIEAKERVRIGRENQTLATITLQNYFRMYKKLSGMTGTALTEAAEFKEIYGLEVVSVPTHLDMIRIDNSDVIYRTKQEKFAAAASEVEESFSRGQPVLLGTSSIENSEKMSKILKARGISHNVLNAKVHDKEAAIVAQAGRLRTVTVATNMAGRGTDIVLGGNAEFMTKEAARKRGVEPGSPEYAEILAGLRSECDEEHKKVVELGGLRIIGIERHESRRIDNQLRGRSGRQGDPGESRFYVALDDDLLRLFGGERVQGIMTKLGMEEGESIEHPLLSRTIEGAQKKVEAMHFDIRKQLLSYDNVMNKQREAVYRERDGILKDDGIEDHTWDIIDDTLSNILERASVGETDGDFSATSLKIKSLFGMGIERHLSGIDTAEGLAEAGEKVRTELRERFDGKISEIGEETSRKLFRHILLQVLDKNWREHLLGLDELRRGIGLRAIGQKDPLLEYQFESYNLFQEMLQGVREKVAEYAFRVMIVAENQDVPASGEGRESRGMLIPVRHAAPGAAELMGDGSKQRPAQRGQKIGRNAPCPCGSGKKYKHCHGRVSAVPAEDRSPTGDRARLSRSAVGSGSAERPL
ncbi:MAG: preprotein translocase subunit SecA [Synergistaceae bacterium]|jgi:preprotein translocase subunit SecA|nr:preprotein translocase subunit SecA [Synergistaceae bacterium]